MMRKLVPCAQDPMLDFDAIIKSKQAPRNELLRGLQGRVHQAYSAHARVLPALEKLLPLDLRLEEREALLHCYDSRTEPLEAMKARIRNKQSPLNRATCQYCGLNMPDTFDHYIPKSLFAEFAVLSHNLLPCCPACNSLRGSDWLKADQRRDFHLYFDEIDESEPLLFAEIDFTEQIPMAIFHVATGPVRNEVFFQRFCSHVERLNLLNRFREAAPEELSKLHGIISDWRSKDPTAILDELRKELQKEQRRLGVHSWKVALLRAVSESGEFIQFALANSPEVWHQREAAV